MSSMRNAVQRRSYRERDQPEERKNWGLLEKHKDYSARARDYNEKKAKLKALRQKVLEKNPDEFYFGMMSRSGPRTGKNATGTIAGDRGNQVISQEVVRLLKTQDLAYIRSARNKATKEVSKLEIAMKGIEGQGQKVVYLEGESDQMDETVDDDTSPGKGKDIDNESRELVDDKQRSRLQRCRAEKLNVRLSVARERLKALADAEQALDLQRARMAKSPTVGGINKHGIKFKVRERKR
ncbi:U3 small nucleolar RNA-associated protein 11 [Erysiphe neolycopersici]|uniref:U3 small nucleolar RNA-associated protein 11 n=1 Tax=Erysiphe neolycopersici TaxID=212602 RepID=A0A420HPA4_9PEZI|nr:U3 small nucleolar RNA-associated protein 11 [Erysiphe neolycopersici]